jgi:LAO/AO transport system kinase
LAYCLSVDVVGLIAEADAGDQRALGRIVSHVSDGDDTGYDLLRLLYPRGGTAAVIGVTGAPGAGKSTLVSGLVGVMKRSRNGTPSRPIAVVAVDPSSPFTGGAILGDRIRMGDHVGDPNVYIRSVANRGHLGGIASSTPAVVAALDGLGFADIVIETVGVGQAEVEVAAASDTTVVVVNPGWGDGIQTAKAGFLEIADIFVVNKADRQGAEEAARELESMLDIGPPESWRPPIVLTTATTGDGVEELHEAIQRHRDHLATSGTLDDRQRTRARHTLIGALRDRVEHRADAISADVVESLVERRTDPWSLAESLIPRQ